jgi:hypothetical protein
MIKKHTAIFIAAALFALPAATQAQSNTASGSFTFTLNPTLPPGDQVQVVGLTDFDFGSITASATQITPVPPQIDRLCFTRSGPGNVLVTVNQTNGSGGSGTTLSNGSSELGLNLVIIDPGPGTGRTMANGAAVSMVQSGTGCTNSSGDDIAHSMLLTPQPIPPASSATSGVFTGQFTITVAPQ